MIACEIRRGSGVVFETENDLSVLIYCYKASLGTLIGGPRCICFCHCKKFEERAIAKSYFYKSFWLDSNLYYLLWDLNFSRLEVNWSLKDEELLHAYVITLGWS